LYSSRGATCTLGATVGIVSCNLRRPSEAAKGRPLGRQLCRGCPFFLRCHVDCGTKILLPGAPCSWDAPCSRGATCLWDAPCALNAPCSRGAPCALNAPCSWGAICLWDAPCSWGAPSPWDAPWFLGCHVGGFLVCPLFLGCHVGGLLVCHVGSLLVCHVAALLRPVGACLPQGGSQLGGPGGLASQMFLSSGGLPGLPCHYFELPVILPGCP